MGDEGKQSVFKTMRLHCDTNNVDHHTSEASQDQLIVRRGQTFRLTLELTHPFQQKLHPLAITATTGPQPSEKQGTRAYLRIPALDPASTSAKAVWKMELDQSSSVSTGVVQLMVTPPADAPVGAYSLTAEHRGESAPLGRLVLLFNPWCPDDDVFLDDEEKRGEYVMNEEGIIYKGSGNYITSMKWDYGQFEDNMVDICLKLLDMSHKHLEDPAEDVSARCDPAYVGRVVSAMINSEDDNGVLKGQWSGPYFGGVTPSHWNGSHDILEKWFNIGCHPVKYGQCWVFAGVMCSVMRFLGIPCRVVTNYNSAHDTNSNLIIDVYHADYGVREKRTRDSVWNFHVWVEGWMRRPDLGDDGRFDGWQVLDPTPQEMSGGVYCCGPAPVKAIHDGEVHLHYDVPFVFAAVNADCVDWLVKADGSQVNIWADTKRVGHNISTKSVGSDKRRNITDTYKHGEGTEEERAVFKYACTRDELKDKEGKKDAGVSRPENGKDVNLKLVVTSNTSVALQLSINITVQAMRHNGTPAVNILSEVKEETLQPWKELSTSVLVPFLTYNQPMLQCESMKIEALVTNKQKPDQMYLAEDNVVLVNPPISLTINGAAKVNQEVMATMVFMNPVNVTLRNCSMTMSGSGLLPQEFTYRLPDLKPQSRFTVRFTLSPFKSGRKTLALDFDCSVFRNIKAWCDFDVLP